MEELSSTNINDLINDDTEVNDDVVDKILNELENTEQDNISHFDDTMHNVPLHSNIDMERNIPLHNEHIMNNNSMQENNGSYFRESDFNNLMKDNTSNESESTVKKINSILNLDVDYNFSILDFILKDLKNPIITTIIVLLTNNMLIINIIETLLIKISNNEFINNIISLVLRSLLSGIIFYIIQILL
jgi:hypothetical protein